MHFGSNKGTVLHEDIYDRSRESGQNASPVPSKISFMKPSEFYSDKPSSALLTKNVYSKSSFGKQIGPGQPLQEQRRVATSSGDNQQQEDYREEYSHYDSGPVSSEEVYETANLEGLVSLKKVITQKQSSTTRNVVSSSRRVIQKREG